MFRGVNMERRSFIKTVITGLSCLPFMGMIKPIETVNASTVDTNIMIGRDDLYLRLTDPNKYYDFAIMESYANNGKIRKIIRSI